MGDCFVAFVDGGGGRGEQVCRNDGSVWWLPDPTVS